MVTDYTYRHIQNVCNLLNHIDANMPQSGRGNVTQFILKPSRHEVYQWTFFRTFSWPLQHVTMITMCNKPLAVGGSSINNYLQHILGLFHRITYCMISNSWPEVRWIIRSTLRRNPSVISAGSISKWSSSLVSFVCSDPECNNNKPPLSVGFRYTIPALCWFKLQYKSIFKGQFQATWGYS